MARCPFRLLRFLVLALWPVAAIVAAEPAAASEIKPPWQRLLEGDDTTKATDLQARIDEAEKADRYNEAIELHEELLALRTTVQGADHWETVNEKWLLDTNRKIAALDAAQRMAWRLALEKAASASELEAKGQYANAEPLRRNVRGKCEELLGQKHPYTAASYNNSAGNLGAQGKYAEAQQLLQKALDLHLELLGENHPNTVKVYNNLAAHLAEMRQHAQALAILKQAAAGYEAARFGLAGLGLDRSVFGAEESPYPLWAALQALSGLAEAAWISAEADLARGFGDEAAWRKGAVLLPEEESRRAAAARQLNQLAQPILELVAKQSRSEADAIQLADLLAQRRAHENELAELAVVVSRRELASLPDVQAALAPGDALVMWVDVTGRDGRFQEHWGCALGASGEPCWERLSGTGDDDKWTTDDSALPEQLKSAVAGVGEMRNLMSLVIASMAIVAADEPKTATEEKPQWQRLLEGDDAKKAAGLQKKIVAAEQAGQYDDAKSLRKELLALRTTAQGADHWETLNEKWELDAACKFAAASVERRVGLQKALQGVIDAQQLEAKGLYAQAEPLWQEYRLRCEQVFGEKHPNTAVIYTNLAANLNAQGKSIEAVSMFEKSLDLHRELLGEKHPNTAASYNNLAFNLQARGRYADAQPLFEKSLDLRRELFGENDPETAAAYGNLAANFEKLGKYDEALPLLQKSLELRIDLLGEKHADTAAGYSNLAYILNALGKYAEALPLFQKSLDLRRELLGEKHPDTAAAYGNLAFNLNSLGKYAEALPLVQVSLDLRRELLGEKHPLTILSYNNLAVNLNAQGNYAEAHPLYEKALELGVDVLGEKHPDTALS